MKMPNFLVIGAGKSGTTSLYFYLDQHPQIYMSPRKEVNFFGVEGEEVEFSGPMDHQEAKVCFSINSIEAYQEIFKKASTEKAIGEISPFYLYSPKASERIQYYIPDVKLIAILRNPVDRAYSNFLHLVRDGREPITDFAQAIQEEETRIKNNWSPSWHYKRAGFYYTLLKPYFDKFDRKQIRIYLYDDYIAHPIATVQDIFQFIGVDESFVPDISVKYNLSGIPKNKILHTLISTHNPIKAKLQQMIPVVLVRTVKTIRDRNLDKPPALPFEIRQQLIEVYRQDIEKLQDLIQQDLSKWLALSQ